MSERKYTVAVVGATGMVGREMISILDERSFPCSKLIPVASERSLDEVVTFNGLDHAVALLKPEIFDDVDIALFSAGGEISKEYASVAASRGAVVIDNTSAFRMEPDVPLIIPEVNPEDISGYKNRNIISNPNCSTIQMVLVLKPLYDFAGIRRVVVSTYQSVSGAGKKAVEELSDQVQALFTQREIVSEAFPYQIAFNPIPQIDVFDESGYTREELKMIDETKKIMHIPEMKLTATAVRVPVFCSHSESINIEFEEPCSAAKVREILKKTPGVTVQDNPAKGEYPLAVEATGLDDVFVGRIREDSSVENGINCWVVSDNLRKGAALNSVQIAELLIERFLK
jgi:aspartate-semialdehyde dehydrogenase